MQKHHITTQIIDGKWTCPDCGVVLKILTQRLKNTQIRSHLKSNRHIKIVNEAKLNDYDNLKDRVNQLERTIGILMKKQD